MDQGRQECGEVDAAVVPRLRRQQGATASLRPGLQPWELPSTAGPAARNQALDPDNDSGEIDQDRGKGRPSRPPGDLPTGRGGGTPEVVPGDPVCNRQTAPSGAGSRMSPIPPSVQSNLKGFGRGVLYGQELRRLPRRWRPQ